MADKEKREVRDADEVVRDYYEGADSADVARNDVRDEFRDAQEIHGTGVGAGEPSDHTAGAGSVVEERASPGGFRRGLVESGGDIDARGDSGGGGEETVGGSHALPDQDIVEEVGKAAGLTYEDAEPWRADEKIADRDAHRWELDPASSEDYQERLHVQREEPAGGKRETTDGGTAKRVRPRKGPA